MRRREFVAAATTMVSGPIAARRAPWSARGFGHGSLFGVHVMVVTLKPGASMADFTTFFLHRVLPEYEKAWVGLHAYLVRSVRGEFKNRLAVMWLFASEAARDRYFDADGTANALETAAQERVRPFEETLAQIGTYTLEYRDDWVVQ